MKNMLIRIHAKTSFWRYLWYEQMAILLLLLVVLSPSASAAMRFQERSLYMNSTDPGATTAYTVSFRYMSPLPVGSVDVLFCDDPVPHHACVTPTGLDASNAVLSSQSGESGFSILTKSTNHIVLSRSPEMITSSGPSSYTFSNIVNPTNSSKAFSVRLRSHASPDATGAQIDFGSVRGQVAEGLVLETQVPPMLIFCLAELVTEGCLDTNDNYYTDMGELSASNTLTAQSQMAVGTNASSGFVITANGAPMSAGTSVIESLRSPSESTQGTNQFGINLVKNTSPQVGNEPEGEWANATVADEYSMPDKYKFVSGDVVAYSPNVSLMKKFTVSYIVNSRDNIRPGVYSTTITFIASGRF